MHLDLKTLEQRWGMALQSASFGVWDLDPRRRLVYYSPEWKRMLGYEASEEFDSTELWRQRVHPDDLAGMLAALTEHLSGRLGAYEHEFRLRAADGSYRWVLSRGRVVERDEHAEPVRMVGTLTDLTDRKEAESLRAARDRAEAANRAKTEFLSRMSHELRTPLNAVLGFAQLLGSKLGQAGVEEQRRHVAHIEQAGWHLLSIINDVMDLSRIESGQLDLHLQVVELEALLGSVCGMLHPMALEREVTLHIDPLAAGTLVQADPTRLRQVFTNLLSNAIKYNRRGGSVHLGVATHCSRDSVPRCVVTVRDTGIGIPPEQMCHLFEPFNRLGRADLGVDGVGIGLVLTRWLLQHMSGSLSVHSEAGVGTSFAVDLPLVPAEALVTAAA
jgi:PAS domain S-box-containing protein